MIFNLIVNWRAKMTPKRGKMALKIDPSKREILYKLSMKLKFIEESKDADYGNNKKDSSFTLCAR